MPTDIYTRRVPSVDEAFWSQVDRNGPAHPTLPYLGPCWLWTGPVNDFGYGSFQRAPFGRWQAHRFAWSLATQATAFPPILHTCDVPNCVRNDTPGVYVVNGVALWRRGHLFLGDRTINAADKVAKGRQGAKPRPGSLHHAAKITEADVVVIRSLRVSGMSYVDIAARYGMSDVMIGYICRRKNWRHVE